MIIGFPASGKSTYAKKLNGEIVSRDIEGGRVIDLVVKAEELLRNGKSIVLDNTHITKESRIPFITLANKLSIPIEAVYIKTSIEDCQIRAITRMFEKYGEVFLTGRAPKEHPAHNDPSIFPPAVLFAARKKLEEPCIDEGFSKIIIIKTPKPKWDGRRFRHKAVFFDIDGTLRKTEHLPLKYPTNSSEVQLFTTKQNMTDKLDKLKKDGFMFFGISNQSGIAKKKVSEQDVRKCFDKTLQLLGIEFPIDFCPHAAVPIMCFCRKPQIGLVLNNILKYKLNPSKCIFIGDMKIDETTASRLSIPFRKSDIFWQ